MEFIGLMEDNITCVKKILLFAGLNSDTTFIYIGKFPKIVCFSMKNEIFDIFKIMLTNV